LRSGARGGCALPSGGASRRPLARHGAAARARPHEPHHVKRSDQPLLLLADDVLATRADDVLATPAGVVRHGTAAKAKHRGAG